MKVVLGLGFGDEGKGLVTDWLCSQSQLPPIVIRFNGGHQAGHTVHRGGYRHVFSNVGSGALTNVPTYWSKACTLDPIAMLNEIDLLRDNGFKPKVLVHENCPIVTPYDVSRNREFEESAKNGSCGVGFAATLQREEQFLSLLAVDLMFPKVFQAKLNNIQRSFHRSITPELWWLFNSKCREFITREEIAIIDQFRIETPAVVFEGAQGLLLDQHYGFYPNVTKSNTGTKNIETILKSNAEIYLVTRAYQTRHGNGFMTNENIPHNINVNPNETNVTNYQGEFRRSLLDVDLLFYGMIRDPIARHAKKHLVITCLDHVTNEHRFTYKGDIIGCSDENDFVSRIANILDINSVFVSHGDTANDITRFR